MSDHLARLASIRQYLAVRLEQKPGRLDKLPLDRRGAVSDAHNPANWQSRDEALALVARLGAGHCLGFVLTAGLGVVVIDIDHCIDPAQPGQYTRQEVHDLAAQLGPHVVWERSVSGTGLHLWMLGQVDPRHRKKKGALECYSSLRFIALGTTFHGDLDAPCPGLPAVMMRYFEPDAEATGAGSESGPVPEWRGPPDTEEGNADLIRRAKASASAGALYGGRARFADLWDANESVLAKSFPHADKPYDESSADLALASHLRFWTGGDKARIERLMRQSALCREKWDGRDDYLSERTIGKACAGGGDVLQDKPPAVEQRMALALSTPPAEVYSPKAEEITGRSFTELPDQVKLFAGCCYVADDHAILTPRGKLRTPSQFKALFGGHVFMLGGVKQKTTTDAFEAFTQSQGMQFPRADETMFRPDLDFGVIEDGAVNVFVPPKIRMVQGDPSPFLRHLQVLLPDGEDHLILLSYIAACAQYPGRKWQWAPVIQGVEGNGKTFFSRVASYAVGKKYAYWPKPAKLTKAFNAWMENHVLYCVEDIYAAAMGGDLLMEELKPMITTTEAFEVEGKGKDQKMVRVVGNFIFNMNHKDGIRKNRNDRRYCMLYCAQQDPESLARTMGDAGEYMRKLYDWFQREDGAAICAHYLKNFPIPPKYNPAEACQRAPKTTSTKESMDYGFSMPEQHVMDRVKEGATGFKGGWVSSKYLQLMQDANPRTGGRNSALGRRDLMRGLGYVPHPGLRDGWTDNPVQPEGVRAVLFVKPGSDQEMPGATPATIAKAYSEAQK